MSRLQFQSASRALCFSAWVMKALDALRRYCEEDLEALLVP